MGSSLKTEATTHTYPTVSLPLEHIERILIYLDSTTLLSFGRSSEVPTRILMILKKGKFWKERLVNVGVVVLPQHLGMFNGISLQRAYIGYHNCDFDIGRFWSWLSRMHLHVWKSALVEGKLIDNETLHPVGLGSRLSSIVKDVILHEEDVDLVKRVMKNVKLNEENERLLRTIRPGLWRGYDQARNAVGM